MSDLVQNGWAVNDGGRVYAIINGSAYEVDAKGTPLAKLPPGDYTEEEARSAIAKLQ